MTCAEHDYHWYPATNEAGWRCCVCNYKPGEPPGFAPGLDRAELYRKVWGLLLDLTNANLVYVSNGSGGDALAEDVAAVCEKLDRYDQYTILRELLGAMAKSHGEYWAKVSVGVLTGKDPRKRCPCGELARSFSGGKSRCFKHGFDWTAPQQEPFETEER